MRNDDFNTLFEGEDFQKMLALMSEEERAEFKRESQQLFAEVSEMFAAFDNRTIHEKLTAAILAQTPDEELVLTVFDTLAVQAPEGMGEEAYLQTLSPARRAVYALYILAGEVDNGGFNQYYYNTGAEAAAYLPEPANSSARPNMPISYAAPTPVTNAKNWPTAKTVRWKVSAPRMKTTRSKPTTTNSTCWKTANLWTACWYVSSAKIQKRLPTDENAAQGRSFMNVQPRRIFQTAFCSKRPSENTTAQPNRGKNPHAAPFGFTASRHRALRPVLSPPFADKAV